MFFETVAQATVDEAVSGRRTASSVHVFGLRHASNVLVVRLDPPEVFALRGDLRRTWSGTEGLPGVLAQEIGVREGDPEPGSPDLGAALDAARQRVGDRVGPLPDLAPLAALAVATPGRVDLATLHTCDATGADVLTSLLRYDLETSLCLEAAGVPPQAWAAATTAWPQGRWQAPTHFLTSAWPDEVVERLRVESERVGLGDEAALASALVQDARSPQSFTGTALQRAWRCRSPRTPKATAWSVGRPRSPPWPSICWAGGLVSRGMRG